MNGGEPFEAWLTIIDDEGDESRLDLLLVRGLDYLGGPLRYHAMAPPQWDGVAVFGKVVCETSAGVELDPARLSIDWPLRPCPAYGMVPEHVHLIGPGALQQTLS